MESWPDEASEQVQDDYDALIDAALGPAQRNLARYNSLLPFALSIGQAGEPGMHVVDPTHLEDSSPAGVLAALYSGLAGRDESIRAAATVREVLVGDHRAILIEAEHRDGSPLRGAAPFTRSRLTRKVLIGEIVLMDAESRLWS